MEVYYVLNSLQRAALAYDPTPANNAPSIAPSSGGDMTTSQAAVALGITARGVRDACERGRLEGQLIEGRWRISRAAVRRYSSPA
jgi:excisionase family DNA binding protein